MKEGRNAPPKISPALGQLQNLEESHVKSVLEVLQNGLDNLLRALILILDSVEFSV
jgi:hypothetical protein